MSRRKPLTREVGFLGRIGVTLFCIALSSVKRAEAKTYSTTFPLNENPISEDGNWISGRTVSGDWAGIQTISGFAFGTQSGRETHDNDSTAILSGDWGPNQTGQAAVRCTNQRNNVWEEVVIRLRSRLTKHACTGYEIDFRCTHDGTQYVEIVRWNGVLDNFTYLARITGPGIRDGDIVAANISGSVITAYINGVRVLTANDTTYTTGNPGMGFYLTLKGKSGSPADFGFSSFTASDESPALLVPPAIVSPIPKTTGRTKDPQARTTGSALPTA